MLFYIDVSVPGVSRSQYLDYTCTISGVNIILDVVTCTLPQLREQGFDIPPITHNTKLEMCECNFPAFLWLCTFLSLMQRRSALMKLLPVRYCIHTDICNDLFATAMRCGVEKDAIDAYRCGVNALENMWIQGKQTLKHSQL